MTNRLSLLLALIVVLALGVDVIFNGAGASYILARKFILFLDWIAFWR